MSRELGFYSEAKTLNSELGIAAHFLNQNVHFKIMIISSLLKAYEKYGI
jgi:hypothetical protein